MIEKTHKTRQNFKEQIIVVFLVRRIRKMRPYKVRTLQNCRNVELKDYFFLTTLLKIMPKLCKMRKVLFSGKIILPLTKKVTFIKKIQIASIASY